MSDTEKASAATQPDPWDPLLQLPCDVTVEVVVPQLTVGTLLALNPGAVLNSQWRTNRDLPMRVNGRLLGWGEFDSGGNGLSIRVTEFVWQQQHS